jgi:hypothetical protein
MFIFFVSNYFAYCATVKTYPGASPVEIAVASALALFIPSSGIIKAIDSMLRRARFRKKRNPLEQAARAGALRMVVRNGHWLPQKGDVFMASIPGIRTGPNNTSEIAKHGINPSILDRLQSPVSSVSAGLPSACVYACGRLLDI